jgi:hypothetical protein
MLVVRKRGLQQAIVTSLRRNGQHANIMFLTIAGVLNFAIEPVETPRVALCHI